MVPRSAAARWSLSCWRWRIIAVQAAVAASAWGWAWAAASERPRAAERAKSESSMLDARYVADNLDEVRRMLTRRSADAAALLVGISSLSGKRRELIGKTEALQAERNAA